MPFRHDSLQPSPGRSEPASEKPPRPYRWWTDIARTRSNNVSTNRKPAGTSDGGQFAPGRRAEQPGGIGVPAAPIEVSEADIARLDAQLSECRAVQSWSPGSIRSSWVPELQNLRAAIDSGDPEAISEAAEAADARSEELAYQVIDRMGIDGLAESIDGHSRGFEFPEISTYAEAMAAVRSIHDQAAEAEEYVHFDDGQDAIPDGFTIKPGTRNADGSWSDGSIIAYAARRSWRDEDYPWVERQVYSD